MNFSLAFYWRLLLQRMPAMLALFLLCVGLSVAMAVRLPETFRTSANLVVQNPEISAELLPQTVAANAAERLEVIEQRLLTRANLIDIANEFDVFEDRASMDSDEVVERMEKATTIRRTSGRNQATFMTISFEGRSPRIVANVVNQYVTKVLEDNAEATGQRVRNTVAFFEEQVAELAAELDAQSAQIVLFKSENSSALPDDLEYRLDRQSQLLERQTRLEREKSSQGNQRAQMLALFDATGQMSEGRVVPQTAEQEQLQQAKRRLANLRLTYSETSPQVQLLQRQVDSLEAVVEEQMANASSQITGNPNASAVEVTLADIDARMATIDEEIAQIETELADLGVGINATPANAIALGALERDYRNIQQLYNNAVARLAQAQVSDQVESGGRGERIEILEAASIPSRPSGPNRPKIIAAGVAAGLGLAGGLFMLLELLNRSIRRPAELTARFGVTPLTVIPFMETRRSQIIRRVTLASAFVVVLVGVPAGLWAIDTYYLPLEVVANRVIDRLGLG